MIAQIIPEAYDAVGRKAFRPVDRKRGLKPTFPIGRYVSQPLSVRCETMEDIRKFLRTCTYVSDDEQFGKKDYWQPPDEFEKVRRGDCDDFALWTWRQLLGLGYRARIVFGRAGRYGDGHAWVTFEKEGKWYLMEPLAAKIADHFPRLSTIRYKPMFSVAYDGGKVSYYIHKKREWSSSFISSFPLAFEWLLFWGWFWLTSLPFLSLAIWRKLRKRYTAGVSR